MAEKSGLNKLMLDRSIFLHFLQNKNISEKWRRKKVLRFRILILIIIIGMFKLFIHLQTSTDSNLVYCLNDICNPFGAAKKIGCTMFVLWLFAALFCGLYLVKIDKYSPKKALQWSKFRQVFENYYFYDLGPFKKQVVMLNFFMKSEMFITLTGTTALQIFLTFTSPKKYIFYNLIYYPIHLLVAYGIVGIFSDFVYLYCFHIYLYSQVFKYQCKKIQQSQAKNVLFKIRSSLIFYTKFYKEVQESYLFYSPIMNIQLIAVFSNQVLSFYFVFFAEIPFQIRLVVISFSLVNLITGFMFHYFFGSYARYQVIISDWGIFHASMNLILI